MDIKISNIKERILYFAKNQNISYELFCESIGMTYGSFKGIAKKRPLNSDALETLITKYPQINCEWLLTGKGNMLLNDISTSTTINESALLEELELKNKALALYKEKVTFLEDKIKRISTENESNEPALLQMIKEIHHIVVSNAINDIIKVNEEKGTKEKQSNTSL